MSKSTFLQVGRANAHAMFHLLEQGDVQGLMKLGDLWNTPLTDEEARDLIRGYKGLDDQARHVLQSVFDNTRFT